jgi:serine/threonine protein kinase
MPENSTTSDRTTPIFGVLPAGARLLEYEVECVLGKPGGFGVTYLAIDTNLQKRVAIKEYLPVDFAIRTSDDSISMRSADDRPAFEWGLRCFLNEARTLAKFRHPNVVQVYRLFEAQNTAYIVLEHVQGRTLSEHLAAHPDLDQRGIESFLLPLLDGLSQVHGAGILHRDLKPENILLRADGSPVLIDFGAARNALGGRSRSIMSVLTTGYAPIEQYSDNGLQGPWTDLYALGAVVHRAILGRKPADAVDRLGADPVVRLGDTPREGFTAEFLRAVDWALRVRAEDRPQSTNLWRDALAGRLAVPPMRPSALDLLSPIGVPVDLELDARSRTQQTAPAPTPTPIPIPTIAPAPAADGDRSRSTSRSRSLPPSSSVDLLSEGDAERTVIYRAPLKIAPPPPVVDDVAVSIAGPVAPSVESTVTPAPPRPAISTRIASVAAPWAARASQALTSLRPLAARASRHRKAAAIAGAALAVLLLVFALWPSRRQTTTAPEATAVATADTAISQPQPQPQPPRPPDHAAASSLESSLDAALQAKAPPAPATTPAPAPAPAATQTAADAAATKTPRAAPAPLPKVVAPQAPAPALPDAKPKDNSAAKQSKPGPAHPIEPVASGSTPRANTAPAADDRATYAGLVGTWEAAVTGQQIQLKPGCPATADQAWTLTVDPSSSARLSGSYRMEWHAVWIPTWGCRFSNNKATTTGQFEIVDSGYALTLNLQPARCSGDCELAHNADFRDHGSFRLRWGRADRMDLNTGIETFEFHRSAR